MTIAGIGTAIKRVEDAALIRGAGRYVDDVKLPGEKAIIFVRSPHAHARITAIDKTRALQMPGVRAIYTFDDVKHLGPLLALNQSGKLRPLLADGVVKHVGEAVVMVVAENRYLAQDAADAVEVTYEPREPLIDVEVAATNCLKVHDDLPSNIINTVETGDAKAVAAAKTRDDVVVVSQRLVNQRVIPLALEPRASLADWNTNRVTLWTTTQIPFGVAGAIGKTFGLPLGNVRVISPDVGGGFGSKLNVYAEEILTCFASRQLGHPIRWTETRREAMVASTHGRGWVTTATLVATRQGDLLAYELIGVADMGAYSQCFTAAIPALGQLAASGTYKIPAIHFKIDCVSTHTMTTDSYRGAGRPEAVYNLERMMDLLAKELGIDAVTLRRRNFWKPQEFPVTTALGVTMDSGNYEANFDTLLDAIDLPALRRQQAEGRAQGRYLGIGFCTFVEPGGLAPSEMADYGISFANYGLPAGSGESATVRVNPDTSLTVTTGTCPSGQGHETVWAQIASTILAFPFERISVLQGDTKGAMLGLGSFSSRSACVGGSAVAKAAEHVRKKAAIIAAHLLNSTPDAIRFVDGHIYAAGIDKTVTWTDLAVTAYHNHRTPPDVQPGLEATVFFDPRGLTWAFGSHVAIVEVQPEIGVVTLLRYVGVDDCGTVINPMIVDGQVHGAIAQGFGQALLEEAIYDEQGHLLSDSLLTYRIPVAENLPSFELHRTVTPSPLNSLGVKGVGEGGAIAAPPALVNAVLDALAPLGVRHLDMPLRPHSVWEAIQQAKEVQYVSQSL
jgi:carbon-monoxide dehydrogenase large subunit